MLAPVEKIREAQRRRDMPNMGRKGEGSDMSHDPQSPTDAADFDDDAWDNTGGPGSQGCYNCFSGWLHGCCDDLCRNSVADEDCPNRRPCSNCNKDGEYEP